MKEPFYPLDFEAKPGTDDYSGLPPNYYNSEQRNYRKYAPFAIAGLAIVAITPFSLVLDAKRSDETLVPTTTQKTIPKTKEMPELPELSPLPPLEEVIPELFLPNTDPKFVLPPPTDHSNPTDTWQSA